MCCITAIRYLPQAAFPGTFDSQAQGGALVSATPAFFWRGLAELRTPWQQPEGARAHGGLGGWGGGEADVRLATEHLNKYRSH